MKSKSVLALLVIFISANTFAQSDTLNQLDSKGKKTGWCIAYLNDNLKVLQDSAGATHCMYNYYINNIHLYRYGEGYGTKESPVIFPENNILKLGSYILLNGTYVTKYKNGNTRSILTASDGFMTNFKKYYPTGKLEFEIIISKKCGAPKQHCVMGYNKDGTVKYRARTLVPKAK